MGIDWGLMGFVGITHARFIDVNQKPKSSKRGLVASFGCDCACEKVSDERRRGILASS
jgi:hypothetical protein